MQYSTYSTCTFVEETAYSSRQVMYQILYRGEKKTVVASPMILFKAALVHQAVLRPGALSARCTFPFSWSLSRIKPQDLTKHERWDKVTAGYCRTSRSCGRSSSVSPTGLDTSLFMGSESLLPHTMLSDLVRFLWRQKRYSRKIP